MFHRLYNSILNSETFRGLKSVFFGGVGEQHQAQSLACMKSSIILLDEWLTIPEFSSTCEAHIYLELCDIYMYSVLASQLLFHSNGFHTTADYIF